MENKNIKENKNLTRSIINLIFSIVGIALTICAIEIPLKRIEQVENNIEPSNFSLSVKSKQNDYSKSKYYEGCSFGLHMLMKNNSSYDVSEFFYDMRISLNSSYNYEYKLSIYLDDNSVFKANTSTSFVVVIDEKQSNKSLALYNASINNLQIECKLTEIIFSSKKDKSYLDTTYNIIKPYGSSGGNTTSEEQEKINEEKYEKAVSLYKNEKYEEALKIFQEILFYKDASNYITNCENGIKEQKYQNALFLCDSNKFDEAIEEFESLSDYKDSKTQIIECKYRKAKVLYESNNLTSSYKLFKEIKTYKDSSTYISNIEENINYKAENYALDGKYKEAINLLNGIGKTEETSDLYLACTNATKGSYQTLVSLLNPSKVIVDSSLKALQDKAFLNCSNVQEIILPDILTNIGNYAFQGCSNLVTINLPDSINKIGDNAFENCTSLSYFNIPSNIETLGGNVLTGCSSLKTISTKILSKYYILSLFTSTPTFLDKDAKWPSTLSKIIITEGTKIPKGFFAYLPNTITEIEFNADIVEVESSAFYNSNVGFILPSTVKKIGDSSYASLGYLGETITIHEGLEYIDSRAFANTGFKTINLPSSLTYIGNNVFFFTNRNGPLNKINFNGTKEKWLSIASSGWNYGMNDDYELSCLDATYKHTLYGGKWTSK